MKTRTKLFIFTLILTMVLSLSLVLGLHTFAAPTTTTTQATTEATTNDIANFYDWLKSLDMSAIRGYAAGVIAYLSANILVIIALVIKLALGRGREVKDNKYYQELTAKMDEEHKKQMQRLADEFTKELESIEQAVTDELKRQNTEKRLEAKESVEKMKGALDKIGLDLDK